MSPPGIAINFYRFDAPERAYAFRRWNAVPRVGDEVMLGATGDDPVVNVGRAAFVVKAVCWNTGSLEDSDRPNWTEVSIMLELVK